MSFFTTDPPGLRQFLIHNHPKTNSAQLGMRDATVSTGPSLDFVFPEPTVGQTRVAKPRSALTLTAGRAWFTSESVS